jgi:hypothetical protein
VWQRRTDFAAQIVYLYRSKFGPEHRIEVGQNIHSIISTQCNRIIDCDIYFAFQRLAPEIARWDPLLDLSNTTFPAEQRSGMIEEALQNDLVPVLQTMLSIEGLRELRATYPDLNQYRIAFPTSVTLGFS